MAGASTSEEVCPWESISETRSRKNSSAQMDSGSSSSDISVAVHDITDRLKRTCQLTQQNTLDGDRRGQSSRKLSTASYAEPRRASVSVPPTASEVAKRTTSSFDDHHVTATELLVNPSAKDNNSKLKKEDETKTFKKSHSLSKTCSVSGANAPIISVSSVMDDTVENPGGEEQESIKTLSLAERGQNLAPLAEPDSESPVSEVPPETEVANLDAVKDYIDVEMIDVAEEELLSAKEDGKTENNADEKNTEEERGREVSNYKDISRAREGCSKDLEKDKEVAREKEKEKHEELEEHPNVEIYKEREKSREVEGNKGIGENRENKGVVTNSEKLRNKEVESHNELEKCKETGKHKEVQTDKEIINPNEVGNSKDKINPMEIGCKKASKETKSPVHIRVREYESTQGVSTKEEETETEKLRSKELANRSDIDTQRRARKDNDGLDEGEVDIELDTNERNTERVSGADGAKENPNAGSSKDGDGSKEGGKSNDVCPWEDE